MSKTGKSRFSRFLPKFLRGDKSGGHEGGTDSKTPFCLVHFLDDSHHQIQFKSNWKGNQLQEKICELLSLHEKDYFGLRFVDSSGQTHWLDGNKSLSSQFKGCQTPHKLYFGVKFYAADPCKLREEITRYLFFLQVKQDILQGRLPVTFDEAAELCAYAVQSELGDFDPQHHTSGYVSEFCFIPNQTEDWEYRVAAIHRRLGGLVPLVAEYRYLDKVKWLDMYGVDLHPVMGEGSVEYFLGLTPTGIVVYKNKNKVGNYFWPRISKVTFKGKIFIVKVKDKNNEEHVYAFELPRKMACKHLWKCCVEHHAFFRLSQSQERSSREKQNFRSVSTGRKSGRSERQAVSDNLSRQSSSVIRLPSRRQPRRINSDSRLNAREHYESQYHRDSGMVTVMMRPEPVKTPRHRSLPELQGQESPRSTKSAPWETNFDYGLYTHGRDSPLSERSNKMREQRNRILSGSDSESGISQRKKYFPNRRGSDNDSDVSVTRRRRRDVDSDSASDVSSRYPASHNNKSSFPVLYPFHDKENRPNGSIPSLHSAPAGETKQRRRRRRSKSPGKRPPEELKQHFEYSLKDTDGMSTEELKEIPFVNVQTKASLFKLKYSPKLRQKVKAAKQRSLGDVDQNSNERKLPTSSVPQKAESSAVNVSNLCVDSSAPSWQANEAADWETSSQHHNRSERSSHPPHNPHSTRSEASQSLELSRGRDRWNWPPQPDGDVPRPQHNIPTSSNHSYRQPHHHHHHHHHHLDNHASPAESYLQGSYLDAAATNRQSHHLDDTGNSRSGSHGYSGQYSRIPNNRGRKTSQHEQFESLPSHDLRNGRSRSAPRGDHLDAQENARSSNYRQRPSADTHYSSPPPISGAAPPPYTDYFSHSSNINSPPPHNSYPLDQHHQAQPTPQQSRGGGGHYPYPSAYKPLDSQHSYNHSHTAAQDRVTTDTGTSRYEGRANSYGIEEEQQRSKDYHHGSEKAWSRLHTSQGERNGRFQSRSEGERERHDGFSHDRLTHGQSRPSSHLAQYGHDGPTRYPHTQASSPYSHLSYQQHSSQNPSQRALSFRNQGTPPRHQGTPPRHQGTPPRNQGTPPRYQETPPRHQGTPPRHQGTPPRYQGPSSRQSFSSTPPRQNADSRYQQGLGAEQHEDGSGGGLNHYHRSTHPPHAPAGSEAPSTSHDAGHYLPSDQARQRPRPSNYTRDLCTEL